MVTKTVSASANTGEYKSPDVTYLEWSPIIAGTILALAISIILLQFSSLFGLQVFHPTQSGDKTRWMVILTSVWLFWVQLISSMAGGYTAGRMRSPISGITSTESETRDGTHGVLVWALGTVLAVIGAALATFMTSLVAIPTDVAEQHKEIAEHLTKNAGIIFGFAAAAGSFVSGAAACYAAIRGGAHRDEVTPAILFRKRK